ncbi:MAG: energy transducer TonB [Gemmatimonadaceae bacterium]
MIALWLAYTVLLGALAAAVALGLERVAALWRLPRRGIWAAAIAVSLLTPPGVHLRPAATSLPAAAAADPGVAAGAVTALATEPPIADRLVERVAEAAAAAARRLAPLDRPLLLLWGIASLAILLALGRSALALRARRRRWGRRVVDGTEVLVAPDLGPAALAGAAPGIVLPQWALDMDAPLRRLVLRHELEHRSAGDPWLLLGGVTALALAPWNVALWWQMGRLRLAVEVDCDARVLRAHGDTPADVERYGLLLLALGQRGGGLLRLAVPALSEPVSTLERRIAAMTDRTPRNRWLRALALAGTAAAVTAVACVTPSPDRIAGPDGNRPAPLSATAQPIADANQTYFEFQVEEPVAPLNNVRPVYPADLSAQGVTGRVIAQFVVGTDGTADVSTFKVLDSDHDLFSAAVKAALPGMRFTTARIGGREVKQLVQQPFVFDVPTRTRGDTTVVRAGTATPAVVGASPRAAQRSPVVVEPNATFFEFQIEEPAAPLNNVQPVYPTELREAGTTGRVIAQFVVDTTGMANVGSFRVLESDHELFTAAVRAALPQMRFIPARVGGRKVRQLLQQPFVFGIK